MAQKELVYFLYQNSKSTMIILLAKKMVLTLYQLKQKWALKAHQHVLNFDNAKGYLIGKENKGLSSMFTMMNLERIIVGIQGLGIAETAFNKTLAYAKERKQGKSNNNTDNKTDLIIKHPDIRRSLMSMKSLIEGQRSLAFWLSQQIDVSLNHSKEKSGRKQMKLYLY